MFFFLCILCLILLLIDRFGARRIARKGKYATQILLFSYFLEIEKINIKVDL